MCEEQKYCKEAKLEGIFDPPSIYNFILEVLQYDIFHVSSNKTLKMSITSSEFYLLFGYSHLQISEQVVGRRNAV